MKTFTTTLAVLFVLSVVPAPTSAAYNASDVLGQISATDQAYFTSNGANNYPDNRHFGFVYGLAMDSVNHHLFVGDGSRIGVYNLTAGNVLADRIMDNVIGQADLKSASLVASQNTTPSVRALLYDPSHARLFVAGDNRVLIFDLSGGITDGMVASKVLCQSDFTSTDSAVTQSGCNNPDSLAYDAANDRLFVGDGDSRRILTFDLGSGITNGMNATHVIGKINFTDGSYGGPGSGQTIFGNPYGLAFDSTTSRLFVGDAGSCCGSGNRVLVFNLSGGITDGMIASNVLGQAFIEDDFGSGPTQNGMAQVRRIALDEVGQRLFVSDQYNVRIMVFDVASITNGENAINVLGHSNFTTGDSGIQTINQSAFTEPHALMFDPGNKYLYVGDPARTLIFDVTAITNGENAVNEFGTMDYTDGPVYTVATLASQRGLEHPEDVAIDTVAHRLFVADSNNNRVLVFNLNAANNLTDRVANSVLGQPNFYLTQSGNTQSTMYHPGGLTYDSAGSRLFVADTNNNRVLVYNVSSITNGENAVNVLGQTNYTNNGAATTQGRLSAPRGVLYQAATNRLYVADKDNNRVIVYNVAAITNGENAVNVLGQTNYTNNAAATTQGGMSGPTGLAYRATGTRLLVSDTSNNRILSYNVTPIANGENAVNVLGQTDYVSNGAATAQGGLSQPTGLTYDATNQRLFASDTDNNRILVFDLTAIANGDNAISVLGQDDFVTSTVAVGQDRLAAPHGLVYDQGNDRLIASDTDNSRVMIFNSASTAFAALRIGSSAATPLSLAAKVGNTVTYSVMLAQAPSARVTIDIAEVDPDNVVRVRNQIAFTKNDWMTPKKVNVKARKRANIQGTQTIMVKHVASSTDPAYNGITIPDVTVVVSQ